MLFSKADRERLERIDKTMMDWLDRTLNILGEITGKLDGIRDGLCDEVRSLRAELIAQKLLKKFARRAGGRKRK